MKQIKTIDVWIQIMLIPSCIIYSCFSKGDYAIVSYFVVGGWQLLSMIFHDINNWFIGKHTQRRRYQNIVYVTVLMMLLSTLIPAFLFIFYLLLYAAPIMAIYYTSLCYTETYQYLKRPLSQLK